MDSEETIITQTLLHLDGWILETDLNNNMTGAEYNKVINRDEVLNFYDVAYDYALSYTKLQEFPTITSETEIDGEVIEETNLVKPISTALYLWTAGLLWNKYNIRSNNQIDETNVSFFGFGDKLVIQAKEMLKSFKNYKFYAY